MLGHLFGRFATVLTILVSCKCAISASEPTLVLHARTRLETSPGSGRFHAIERPLEWDPKKTAIVICDMWDRHWCKGATARVAEMAPRMDEVVAAARNRGVLIIHCPSDTMKFYEGWPERKLAQEAPKASGSAPIRNWCAIEGKGEPKLPIDDSDGGCDCWPPCRQGSPWRRQIDRISIQSGDAITDSAQAFYLMRQRGIENVILMGVHTNMCVLGRPFAIRQMKRLGQRVVLMRDLTDTMYNSRRPPYVSHFTGTDLVIEHIEKYLCPTVTSTDLTGGALFRFKADQRKRIAIIMAEDEYKTETTLPPFALAELGRDFQIHLIFGDDRDKGTIPGLHVLSHADLALISVRRRVIAPGELASIQQFVRSQKPVVGIRTASHAFSPRGNQPVPKGKAVWPTFDAEVLGGNYHGHHSTNGARVRAEPAQKDHPILKGIGGAEFSVASSLYRTSPLAPKTTLLAVGQAPDQGQPEPVAWTFERADGGRTFYTSLGHKDDFTVPEARRLLVNGIYWAAGLPVPDQLFTPPANDKARTLLDRVLPAVSAKVAPVIQQKTALARGPLPPRESMARFKVPSDLAVDLVAAEPEVRQPLFLTFDERGRMWVVQYLQYPEPAGLKRLSMDRYWRSVYDKVPPPPPKGPRGRDKITVHEDTDGDGIFDRHKTFIDGLNIATAVERGRGGVWVLNPPYLLFYADQNGDDVPDGDPEVHLEGFGLEDTHSVVNSLCWGPDGWLYAAQGSTVTGQIRRPGGKEKPRSSMGQLIWRYHPERRIYEIFAEGGGNAFGCEIDAQGRVFSGHNGGDTRGFHYVQGSYSQKGFNKHGPLSNPYAFGYFPPMPHHSVPRFTHNFLIYDGVGLPETYRGKLFGVAPLLAHVVISERIPVGSSFRTKDIGYAIDSGDPWFRPVDIKHGPDGALYVADWYDAQVAHPQNHEGKMDASTGRIYRVRGTNLKSHAVANLATRSSDELANELAHPNRWHRRTALRLLGDRKDRSVLPKLEAMVAANRAGSLEALWAIHQIGGLEPALGQRYLKHADPFVRLWTVRLLVDSEKVAAALALAIAELAAREPNAEVRSQLAASARRLPAELGLPIVRQLLARNEDLRDPHIPLLLWWAIETFISDGSAFVPELASDPAFWDLPIVQEHLLARWMRRYAQTGEAKDALVCARLLSSAPSATTRKKLLEGFEEAFSGRPVAELPAELLAALDASGGMPFLLRLRRGEAATVQAALGELANPNTKESRRIEIIRVFGEVRIPAGVPVLMAVLENDTNRPVQRAILAALARYDDPDIAERILRWIPSQSRDIRAGAISLLAGRPTWAMALVTAVQKRRLEAATVDSQTVQTIRLHQDARLAAAAQAVWGTAEPSPKSPAANAEKVAALVMSGSGSPYTGKALFLANCAKCHRMYGQGESVGPDLTSFRREDVMAMARSIVDPSAEIREGYENHLVATSDGRIAMGTLLRQDSQVVVLKSAEAQVVAIQRKEIEQQRLLKQSLMPEGLLKELSEQQVRDLFAYLRGTQPLND